MTGRASSRSMGRSILRPRTVVLAVVGLLIVWPIANSSLVSVYADRRPEIALLLSADEPAALIRRAERLLQRLDPAIAVSGGDGDPGNGSSDDRWSLNNEPPNEPIANESGAPDKAVDVASATSVVDGSKLPDLIPSNEPNAKARELLRRALAREPANARALALLGLLADEDGDKDAARQLITSAAKRSQRVASAQAWLVDQAIQQQDWALAMQRVDALLRLHPNYTDALAPLITRIAEKEAAAPHLMAILATAPAWRRRFMTRVVNHITDARTPLDILLELNEGPAPPEQRELSAYIDFLMRRKLYDLAYYTWLQFLPSEQLATVGLLFNGSFETRPSGLPFDWVLPSRSAANVEVTRRPDRPDQRALLVELNDNSKDTVDLEQVVRLRPGRFVMEGRIMGELISRRGLKWEVRCLDSRGEAIGQSQLLSGQFKTWQVFTFTIDVPETDCTAQRVRLSFDARMRSERLVAGSVLFDDLVISPMVSTEKQGVDGQSPRENAPQR